MNRRQFIKSATAASALLAGCSPTRRASVQGMTRPVRRARPGDASWPSEARWEQLRRDVRGRLVRVESPVDACRRAPRGEACAEFVAELKNPYYIGDEPALTQTSGWVDAWTSAPSVYAVAAEDAADVAAAVDFARTHNLRLVIKGGGHSYQGTSCSADSLLIWTRAMNGITLHDDFVPEGCAGIVEPQPAVSVGAGAMWGQAYDAVTTRAGRYVQGGGCTTVGVAGLIQSGGFGSFSKRYGSAAAGLLEAEVVTADGAVRIANAGTNPDLFWALKGGGGGTFGVVTRLTLRTRELPEYFGGVFGTIQANTDAAYRRLVARLVAFSADNLVDPHWGEQLRFGPGNVAHIGMVFQGLNETQAREVWRPILDLVNGAPDELTWRTPFDLAVLPARHFWDASFLRKNFPALIVDDDRSGARETSFLWAGDQGQVGQFLHGFHSAWLSASLLEENRQRELTEALVASSREWEVSLQFNKGLAGAPPSDLAAARDTAMNPAALDAFALAVIAGGGPPAFPGAPGPGPDLEAARRDASIISRSMDELLEVSPDAGSYVAESDYFERAWKQSFWGSNYRRLAAVKRKYDPTGLFFVHHGVGSDEQTGSGLES